ncbi:MAG: ribosomal protein S18-alanine N-acetyltransferase [Candidatus Thorarchaeota archaeon]
MITTIRSAELKDIVRIVLIENECFDEPWSPEIFLGIVSSGGKMPLGSSRVMLNILEQENKLIGYIVWSVNHEHKEGRILNIAVNKTHRGTGFGKELLRYVISSMKTQGITTCLLEVRVSNLPAIKLYESFGMSPIDRVPGYYSNQEDAIIYELEL